MNEREQQRRAAIVKYREDQAPVVADLARAGFRVDNIQDLYARRIDYRAAIPILLDWLPRMSNLDVKETIVRALSVRWAKRVAAPALVREFHDAPATKASLQWAIGSALEVVADDSIFDELVEILQNRSYGTARQMVAMAMGRMKNPRAAVVLLGEIDDETIHGHVIWALGKLRYVGARPAIERFSKHPNGWIRKEVRKALTRIDQTGERIH